MRRTLAPILLATLLAACSREGQIGNGGIYTARSACPQVAIPAGTGDITLFNPADSRSADAIDVSATITNLRGTCSEGEGIVASTATFDVVASRRDAGPARQVVLPTFNVAMQGGESVVAKRVGQVVLDFPAGALRTQTSATATIRVDLAAVTLPPEVRAELTRRRKPGDVDAAVDPLTIPSVRDAVARATFEQLVGFQLSPDQLRYNVTR
ncbi:hypothetical protein [Sphingomicrobium lutaoense]|uniref:Lipoprotein n=1 Tax=Sphingomicrobium lutaoense TaxID=515949 RepID=A0A839Z2G9_9SPHN|nr:hypothetical protein [Sphingomicrobium lutaoense]MBB3763953.1 hypothetical protein [Sphingomicrobium lutaoense]